MEVSKVFWKVSVQLSIAEFNIYYQQKYVNPF